MVVNDLDTECAAGVVREIESGGGTAVACAGDVTGEEFGERFVSCAVGTFGGWTSSSTTRATPGTQSFSG